MYDTKQVIVSASPQNEKTYSMPGSKKLEIGLNYGKSL